MPTNTIFPLKEKILIRGFAEHVAAGLGGAADYKAVYVPVFSSFDGLVYWFNEPGGGTWLGIIRDTDQIRVEHAHLSQRLVGNGEHVARGQLVAVSGNTGTTTTGPHLHTQCFMPLGMTRIDPVIFYEGASMPQDNENADLENKSVIQNPGGQKGFFRGGKLHPYRVLDPATGAQTPFVNGYEQYSFIKVSLTIAASRYKSLPKGTLTAEEVLKGGRDW